MTNQPEGWVFCDEDGEEIGFAEPDNYRDAEQALEGFMTGDHVEVFFRTKDGTLHSCDAESRPEDFQS